MLFRGMRVPDSWNGMGYMAKVYYLVDSHQAKDIEDAKAKLRRPKPAMSPKQQTFWWSD